MGHDPAPAAVVGRATSASTPGAAGGGAASQVVDGLLLQQGQQEAAASGAAANAGLVAAGNQQQETQTQQQLADASGRSAVDSLVGLTGGAVPGALGGTRTLEASQTQLMAAGGSDVAL